MTAAGFFASIPTSSLLYPVYKELIDEARTHTERKHKIVRTGRQDFPYNVQVLVAVDDGEFQYCGVGKHCRNIREVRDYLKEIRFN